MDKPPIIYSSYDWKEFEQEVVRDPMKFSRSCGSTIYLFDARDWSEVVQFFAYLNIQIVGGHSNTRHVISPQQIELRRFMYWICDNDAKKVRKWFNLHKFNNEKLMGTGKHTLSRIQESGVKLPLVKTDRPWGLDLTKLQRYK